MNPFSQLKAGIKYLIACNPPDIRLATRPDRFSRCAARAGGNKQFLKLDDKDFSPWDQKSLICVSALK
jgi:hypothetical protein